MAQGDDAVRHHDNEPLHQVFQFAHIARPGVILEGRDDLLVEFLGVPAFLAAEKLHEVAGEQGDVLAPVAQRRNGQGQYVQAVEEVLAKVSRADLLLEVLVGRRYDTHINLYGAIAADPLEFMLLKDPENLGLGFQAHVADFVEKKRAVVGLVEFPLALGGGAGKGPLFVAEQL